MILQKKKEIAEADGLDPNTIKCTVTTEWAKVGMMVTAATAPSISLSKKEHNCFNAKTRGKTASMSSRVFHHRVPVCGPWRPLPCLWTISP